MTKQHNSIRYPPIDTMEIQGEHWEPMRESASHSISSLGRLRNDTTGTILRTSTNQRGKLKCGISVHSIPVTVYLAEAVWAAFFEPLLGPLPEGAVIAHRDGDRRNCAAANLTTETVDERQERQRRKAESLLRPWPGARGRRRRGKPGKGARSTDVLTDESFSHQKKKVARACRHGHPLSMTEQDDQNTLMWGVGNRVCKTCTGAESLAPIRQYHGYYGVAHPPESHE